MKKRKERQKWRSFCLRGKWMYDKMKKRIAVWRLVTLCKGGDAMYVTYSDLIQKGMLIVAIIALYQTGNR